MSVGFGFSASDFIAALTLVGTVIDALREAGGAGTDYRELLRQLHTLETALIRVKRLDLEEVQHSERVALQQAASQCQRTIDDFWQKIRNYQPHLGQYSFRLKSAWMKIKWATCKKEDLSKFKADILAHTTSIDLMLTTVQMDSIAIESRKNDQRHRTLAGRMQDASFQYMKKLADLAVAVASSVQQGKELLNITADIMYTNIKVFQIVCNLQALITRLPGQVERQQPVYLIDALGKAAPFHLEFVRSREAFLAILKVNFSKIGSGAKKIERGEFFIQDTHSKRQIDLQADWNCCFLPGQRVDMSIVFFKTPYRVNVCPGCEHPCEALPDKDVECVSCGMMFRTIIELEKDSFAKPFVTQPEGQSSRAREPLSVSLNMSSAKRKRPEDDRDDDLRLFRRVRLIGPRRNSHMRCKVWEIEDNILHDRGIGICTLDRSSLVLGSLIVTSEDDPDQTLLRSEFPLAQYYQYQSGMVPASRDEGQTDEALLLDGVIRWRTLIGREYGLSFESSTGFLGTMAFLGPYLAPYSLPKKDFCDTDEIQDGNWGISGIPYIFDTVPPPLPPPKYIADIVLERDLECQWEKSDIQGEREPRSVSPVTAVPWTTHDWEPGTQSHNARRD
ncbi:hypothetical protein MMC27_004606 [Xylographa pallens]|nr:hypothetical protein [Xylographa pallens]